LRHAKAYLAGLSREGCLYTSGTVFHAFLGEKLPDWKAAASLVRKIAENYTLPYYTLSPTYSICKNHGYLAGEQYTCPTCGESAEVYSLITDYYRPVQNWNAGKAEEYRARRVYDVPESIPLGGSPREEGAQTRRAEPAGIGEIHLFTTKTCPNCGIAKSYWTKRVFATTSSTQWNAMIWLTFTASSRSDADRPLRDGRFQLSERVPDPEVSRREEAWAADNRSIRTDRIRGARSNKRNERWCINESNKCNEKHLYVLERQNHD
jgi:predicted RNA-binding Zn-ribbon protein involved in translation (DUF1610 family)